MALSKTATFIILIVCGVLFLLCQIPAQAQGLVGVPPDHPNHVHWVQVAEATRDVRALADYSYDDFRMIGQKTALALSIFCGLMLGIVRLHESRQIAFLKARQGVCAKETTSRFRCRLYQVPFVTAIPLFFLWVWYADTSWLVLGLGIFLLSLARFIELDELYRWKEKPCRTAIRACVQAIVVIGLPASVYWYSCVFLQPPWTAYCGLGT